MAKHRRRWLPTVLGLGLVGGLVVLATQLGDPRRYAELVKGAEPRWLIPAVAVQLATYPATGAIYARVLGHAGHRERLVDMTGLALAKLFTDQALPTGGLAGSVVVARGLQKRGIDEPTAAAAVLVDLIAHYATFALLLGLALAFLLVHHDLGAVILVPAGAFVAAAVAIPGLVLWVNARGADHLPRALGRVPSLRSAAVAVAEAPAALLRSPAVLAEVGVLEGVVFALDALTLDFVLASLGAHHRPATAFAAYTIAYLAGTVGMLPGGLGTFEAAAVATLTLLGEGFEGAVAATLLLRLLTFWLPMIPGAVLARKELAA